MRGRGPAPWPRAVGQRGRGGGCEISQVAVVAAQEVAPALIAQREPEAAEQGRGDKGEELA